MPHEASIEPRQGGPVRRHAVYHRAARTGERVRLMIGVCLALLLLGTAARAQSVDYNSFEQLFGEPVTTSATGKPQRVSDVPANMEIITADDIRRSGADNIPDILRFVAGIDVRRYGFAAADVGIRGYNETSNPRLLVLVNGQQVYLDDLGRTQWYTLPVQLDEIRQIEVVKGPNTALFGFNAASGVINIVTYDPMRDRINTVTARGGTQGYGSLSAVGTGQIADKGGVRISADGFRANEFAPTNVAPAFLPFRSSPERGAFSLDGRVTVSPGIELFAAGSVVDTRVWEATATPNFATDYLRTNWSRIGLAADTVVGMLGLTLYRNELRYAYSSIQQPSNVHDTIYVMQASNLVKLTADHTIRIGLDYRNNAATSPSLLPGRVGYEVYSSSLMWDWQITPIVSLTNAVRLDHLVLTHDGQSVSQVGFNQPQFSGHTLDVPSFNSGLVWKATERDTFRFLAGRGLQLPSLYDFALYDRYTDLPDHVTFLYSGNPALHAASVLNAEVNWDRTLPWLNSTLRTAVFAQRTENVLSGAGEMTAFPAGLLPGGVMQFVATAANTGNSSAFGTEIGLSGHSLSGLRWKTSYSLISITDHLSINQYSVSSSEDFARGTPAHVVVAGAGYTRGGWEIDVQARWQSQFTDYRTNISMRHLIPVRVDNHAVLDGRVGYTVVPGVTTSLTVLQLNNSAILQSAGPPVERRVLVGVMARF